MLKITCVTENTAQRGSPYWGEHGLSFFIETGQGNVLFDTGQTTSVLLHNLAALGKSLSTVDAVALSHAHNDHTGGLPVVLSQRPGIPLFANPDLGRLRFSRKNDRYRYIGMPLPAEALAHAATLHLNAEPAEIVPGLWTTGEIPDRPEPEGRSPNHFVPQGDGWLPDPYRDDMSLVAETNEGLILICGCCHAGLLNTLAHVRRMFDRPIIVVLGGTHLVSAKGPTLAHMVATLQAAYAPLRLYPNHCSGEQAYVALATTFGDQVQPCPAGTTLTFD